MPNADSRCATRTPIRPSPTIPTRLLVELDAGVLAALPLTPAQGCVRGGDVSRSGEQQADRELGGADDVGGRCVDDHDTRLGGLPDVDVVETDAGAGDDLEPLGGSQGLGVDLRGAAHEDRVDVGDGLEQLGGVGAVAVADLEVRTERLDGGRGQLFGDQDDGACGGDGSVGHEESFCGGGVGSRRRPRAVETTGAAGAPRRARATRQSRRPTLDTSVLTPEPGRSAKARSAQVLIIFGRRCQRGPAPGPELRRPAARPRVQKSDVVLGFAPTLEDRSAESATRRTATARSPWTWAEPGAGEVTWRHDRRCRRTPCSGIGPSGSARGGPFGVVVVV